MEYLWVSLRLIYAFFLVLVFFPDIRKQKAVQPDDNV